MNTKESENLIETSMIHFKMPFVKQVLPHSIATLFIVEDFGLVVCCFEIKDYVQVTNILVNKYTDWRYVLISPDDNFNDKRFEILWNLMRGGYMKWLRYNFPNQTNNILNGIENLGRRIIEKRLDVWGNKPKYKFMVEDNRSVLLHGTMRELATDPGFFDYMPEEEV